MGRFASNVFFFVGANPANHPNLQRFLLQCDGPRSGLVPPHGSVCFITETQSILSKTVDEDFPKDSAGLGVVDPQKLLKTFALDLKELYLRKNQEIFQNVCFLLN